MHPKHLVISYDSFMERFVPPVSERRRSNFTKVLKNVRVKAGEDVEMCSAFAASMNDKNICPGFKFVVTSSRGGPSDSSNEAVEVGFYPLGSEPLPEKGHRGKIRSPAPDWWAVELCVECRSEGPKYDPFYEETDGCEPTTTERKNTFQQILSHAELIFKYQQRTCIFMVLLLGSACRIVRFDRSGVVATKKFNYKTRGSMLADFLWRYSRWDADQRGHDTSAELIAHDSDLGKAMKARAQDSVDSKNPGDYVRRQFSESLRDDWSWWKLRVDDENGRVRHFLVGKPHFQSPAVAGRGTRGYIALDADNIDGPFYYLKDTWRVVSPGIDKEGTVLKYLNEWREKSGEEGEGQGQKGVPHVPTLECHGDVRRTLASSTTEALPAGKGWSGDSHWQLTRTQKAWQDLHKDDSESLCRFRKHKHYRVVVREVGKPMVEFGNGHQLVHALLCCLHAHRKAYIAGVIHRDISAGNVLLYFDPVKRRWSGLLNDWELSKQTNSRRPAGRQLDRTGTWQFMSAHALEHAAKEIVVEDELESFFHVLLFFAIRFLPNNCDNVASFMNSYFDDYSTVNTIFTCGTFKMLCMVDGSIKLRRGGNANLAAKELCFMTSSTPGNISSAAAANSKPHPVDEILKTVLEWLRAHYAITDREGLFRGPSTSAAPALNPEVEAEDESDEEEEGEEDDNDYLEPTAYEDAGPVREYSSKAATKEWWEEQERLAKNLRTHNAFVDLLEEYVWKRKWPKRDKVEDQLVKGSNPNAKMPSDQVKKGGSVDENGGSALSSKRKSGEMDAPAQQGRPKRSKSGNTSVMPRRDE